MHKRRRQDGKDTETAFKRRRRAALRLEVVPFGSGPAENVFGHARVPRAELRRLQREEESETFRKLVAKAKAKREAAAAAALKAEESLDAREAGGQGTRFQRACLLTPKKRKEVQKKALKKRRASAASAFGGDYAWSWRTLLRSLDGKPRVYIAPGTPLPGRRLDEEFGGAPLRDYVEHDLVSFVSSTEASPRRIILVPSIASPPLPSLLAARVLGARLQEKLLVPLLQFSEMPARRVAFSSAFVQANKAVVGVARAANSRLGGETLRVFKAKTFWGMVDDLLAKRPKAKKKATQAYAFIYESAEEPEVAALDATKAGFAVSFSAFLRSTEVVQLTPMC